MPDRRREPEAAGALAGPQRARIPRRVCGSSRIRTCVARRAFGVFLDFVAAEIGGRCESLVRGLSGSRRCADSSSRIRCSRPATLSLWLGRLALAVFPDRGLLTRFEGVELEAGLSRPRRRIARWPGSPTLLAIAAFVRIWNEGHKGLRPGACRRPAAGGARPARLSRRARDRRHDRPADARRRPPTGRTRRASPPPAGRCRRATAGARGRFPPGCGPASARPRRGSRGSTSPCRRTPPSRSHARRRMRGASPSWTPRPPGGRSQGGAHRRVRAHARPAAADRARDPGATDP